jgi:hypothetical protein
LYKLKRVTAGYMNYISIKLLERENENTEQGEKEGIKFCTS